MLCGKNTLFMILRNDVTVFCYYAISHLSIINYCFGYFKCHLGLVTPDKSELVNFISQKQPGVPLIYHRLWLYCGVVVSHTIKLKTMDSLIKMPNIHLSFYNSYSNFIELSSY